MPANQSNKPLVLIPTDQAYSTSTLRTIGVEHRIPTPQQPGMYPGISYRPPSGSRRAEFPQVNDDQDDECVDDSDDGQGQGSSFSIAGPCYDIGQGMQGQEKLLEGWRKARGCEWEDKGNIGTPMAHNDDGEHTLQDIS